MYGGKERQDGRQGCSGKKRQHEELVHRGISQSVSEKYRKVDYVSLGGKNEIAKIIFQETE